MRLPRELWGRPRAQRERCSCGLRGEFRRGGTENDVIYRQSGDASDTWRRDREDRSSMFTQRSSNYEDGQDYS